MALETTAFDPAEFLDDDAAIAGYLSDALETADPAFIADALGVVARAKGMQEIAASAGLSRESLYRGKSTEADLVQAGIAALVKKSMDEATARSVAQIVYNAHFKVWEGV